MLKLNEKQLRLVSENLGLLGIVAKKIGVKPWNMAYQELISDGMVALIKAAKTFDEKKGFQFSTYASKCIRNKMYSHFRKKGSKTQYISVGDYHPDSEYENLLIRRAMEEFEFYYVENLQLHEIAIQTVNTILNCLENRSRNALLYRIAGLNVEAAGRKINTPRSTTSRVQKKAITDIQNISCTNYSIKFYMTEHEYQVTLAISNVREAKKRLQEFPNDKIQINSDGIVVIKTAADPEEFELIADILQAIDELIMK